jgi:predicted nucleic acid-binding protein
MTVFIDTSAFYALLDRDDANHARAKKVWTELLESDTALATSNYIVVESSALVQNRLGLEALRAFYEDLLPLAHIEWVYEPVHRSGLSALLAVSKRKLSLVDCVSFEIMRRQGIKSAFVFDPHFEEQGFHGVP